MAAGVADGEAEHLAVERDEVEEVPAHLFRRHRPRRQIEAGELGQLVEEEALLDLRRLPEAAAHALFHEARAEGGAHRVEGEVQLLANPGLAHEQEDEVAVAAGADRERGRGAAGKDPRPRRRAFPRRVGEDVDAVLQNEGHRRGARVERVAGGVAQVADRLHEGKAVATLRVEDGGAQPEVVPQRAERLFEERHHHLLAGPGDVERAEHAVEPAVQELGLEMGRAVHENP